MTTSLETLLKLGAGKTGQFPANSRYQHVETAAIKSGGRSTVYLRRRFVPPPERFTLLEQHTVIQGDRLDNLSARYFGDPELYWRICDANRAMRPEELTERVGARLRITLPEGVQGAKGG